MKITRTSPYTGAENTREIDVTPEQIKLWESGVMIQEAMPHLSAHDREFIKSGLTSEDWDEICGDSEDED